MSRSAARALSVMIDTVIAPLDRKRRAMTIARLIERLETKNTVLIQTSRGPLKLLTHRGPHLAVAALDFDNEEPETLAWIDTIEDGETLWDVGAATGLLSMYAALKPGVRVCAFEPKATSFGVLVEHLALNQLGDKIFPHCVAFSDETSLTRLSITAMAAGSGGNSVAGQPNQFGEFHNAFSQGVLAYRIDDFRSTFALPAPEHLKIDVDGVEGAILLGAAETLKQVKSVMIEVEGQNAEQASRLIEAPIFAAGLVEDVAVRTSGSRRNRLYRRP